MQCPQCGTDNRNGVTTCVTCGYSLTNQEKFDIPILQDTKNLNTTTPDSTNQYPQYSTIPVSSKSKSTAGLLAILLGNFGAHKFYLSNTGMGILYLLFCWTGVPGVIGIIEGITYLSMSDRDFANKYH